MVVFDLLGHIHRARNEHDAALQAFRTVAKLRSIDSGIHHNLETEAHSQKLYEEAAVHFQEAVNRDDTNEHA